jgi:CRISPR-associated endonuclease/helicase Cas3
MGDKNQKRRKNIKYNFMLNFNSHPNTSIKEHIKNMGQKDDSLLALKVKYFHDLGKASKEFQKKLRGEESTNASHAIESAVLFFIMNHNKTNLKEMTAALLAIRCHHVRLKNVEQMFKNNDYGEVIAFAARQLEKEETFENLPAVYRNKFELLKSGTKDFSGLLEKQIRKAVRDKFSIKDVLNQRFLFSNLIFNDKYSVITGGKFNSSYPCFNSVFEKYISDKYASSKSNIKDEFRDGILKKYSENKDKKIFVISAPTGISKTLTSLALAEQIGKKIVFAPPITAIIDQVYDDIKTICAGKIKFAKIHHKTFVEIENDENDDERYNKEKFLSETLHGDIVVTTQWQIMSAFFSNSNSDCAKMYLLKNSTIIIDEVQSLPHEIIDIFERYIAELSEQYNITFILMSATMPNFTKDFCKLSDDKFFSCYNRYKLEWLSGTKMCAAAIDENKKIVINSIVKSAQNSNKILVVLNQIATAQEIFMMLKKRKELKSYKILSLTTYMLEEHRNRVIRQIKNADKNEKIILVSTQSIEAGVDLDFDVGFREAAPVSSIIQTAGRVNRYGFNEESKMRTLFVFGMISKYTDKIYGDMFTVSKSFLAGLEEKKTIFEKDILGAVKSYFKKLPKNNSIDKYINTAAHEEIHKEVFKKYIEVEDFKESLYVADEKNEERCFEIVRLHQERLALGKSQDRDKFFKINKKIDMLFKKYISPNIIKVSKQDIYNASSFNNRYCSKAPKLYENIYVINKEYYDDRDIGIMKKSVIEKNSDEVSDILIS